MNIDKDLQPLDNVTVNTRTGSATATRLRAGGGMSFGDRMSIEAWGADSVSRFGVLE